MFGHVRDFKRLTGPSTADRKENDTMRGMGMETPERAEDSLARIAKALERIADAEEERNRMARGTIDRHRRIEALCEDMREEDERWGASRSSTATPRR